MAVLSMVTSWTKEGSNAASWSVVPKNTSTWTPVGKNGASWALVPKPQPTTSVITQVTTGGGDPIGLLLALTYAGGTTITSVLTSIWTPLSNNLTPWTGVNKAT